MKHFPLILLLLALPLAFSCVGQVDDEEDPAPQGGVVADAAGQSLIIDFTATWCVNCPRMTGAIEEAMAERPGAIVPLCVHYGDALACSDGNSLVKLFGIENYPSAIVDMDVKSRTNAASKEKILSLVDERKPLKKPACDIVATALSPSEGHLDVSVGVTAAAQGEYLLWVLLVRDGIVAAQTGGSADEVHNHVLRRFLHAGEAGDSLGTLAEGVSGSWEASFDGLELDGCRLIVFLTEAGSGLVNAILSVPIV